jgi:transcriptional regulator with XRE-family HTH domain
MTAPDDKRAGTFTESVERYLAERVQYAREKRGWTQQVLADECGLRRGQISQIESARGHCSIATLCLIALMLSVSTDFLLGRTDRMQPGKRPEPFE